MDVHNRPMTICIDQQSIFIHEMAEVFPIESKTIYETAQHTIYASSSFVCQRVYRRHIQSCPLHIQSIFCVLLLLRWFSSFLSWHPITISLSIYGMHISCTRLLSCPLQPRILTHIQICAHNITQIHEHSESRKNPKNTNMFCHHPSAFIYRKHEDLIFLCNWMWMNMTRYLFAIFSAPVPHSLFHFELSVCTATMILLHKRDMTNRCVYVAHTRMGMEKSEIWNIIYATIECNVLVKNVSEKTTIRQKERMNRINVEMLCLPASRKHTFHISM